MNRLVAVLAVLLISSCSQSPQKINSTDSNHFLQSSSERISITNSGPGQHEAIAVQLREIAKLESAIKEVDSEIAAFKALLGEPVYPRHGFAMPLPETYEGLTNHVLALKQRLERRKNELGNLPRSPVLRQRSEER